MVYSLHYNFIFLFFKWSNCVLSPVLHWVIGKKRNDTSSNGNTFSPGTKWIVYSMKKHFILTLFNIRELRELFK